MIEDKNTTSPLKSRLFRLSIIIPLIPVVISGFIIYLDKQPTLCFSKDCLDMFFDLFKIPIRISGLVILFPTLFISFYRIQSTYSQNERLLKQDIIRSYSDHRDSFKQLLDETKIHYEFKILKINSEWLLSALYPNAKHGDDEIQEAVKYELLTELPEYFQSLQRQLSENDTDKFYTEPYRDIYDIYERLSHVIPISQSTNYKKSEYHFFITSDENLQIINLIKDIAELATVINAFHSWEWFSYQDTLNWQELIKEIQTQMQTVSLINNTIDTILEKESELIKSLSSFSDYITIPTITEHNTFHRLRELGERPVIERQLAYEIILSHIDSTPAKEYIEKTRQILNINPDVYELSVFFKNDLDSLRFKKLNV